MADTELYKKIIFCADDFGLTKSISQSIIRLSKLKKIEATSVMVGVNDSKNNEFVENIKELNRNNIKIGLHFYLTTKPILINEKEVQIKHPLQVYLYIIKYGENFIKKEFYRQFNELSATIDGKEFYIDSHHYLLSYPIISTIIFNEIKKNNDLQKFTYKLPTNKGTCLKSKILNIMSSITKKRNKNLQFIDGILGIHNFNFSYEQLKTHVTEECQKITSGIWHFSTHPSEYVEDIVGVDELVEFRKIDYLFLKEKE